MNLPFEEKKSGSAYIRKFSQDLDSSDLKWHQDEEDRTVTSLSETDWMFQRDNELPVKISGEIEIKANEWHRIIKGTGDLEVKIVKH